MEIKKVKRADIDYLALGKQIDTWPPSVRSEYAYKALTDIQRGYGTRGLIAYDDDELVGVLSYEEYTDRINLSFLGTKNSGVGARMVDEIKQNGQMIALLAEAGADGFWARQGFERIKNGTYVWG